MGFLALNFHLNQIHLEEEVRILLMEEEEVVQVFHIFQVDLVQMEIQGKKINLHIEVPTILLAHQIQEGIQVVIQVEIHHSQIEMKGIRSEGYKCYWQRQIICT